MQTLKQYIAKHYSESSRGGYYTMIIRYTTWMNGQAEMASYTDVLNYIGYLRKLKLHPKSLRNNLFAIKIYYRWLVAIGKREDHPCQKLYLQDQINRAIAVESLYTPQMLEELLRTYKSKTEFLQQRDEIIITLLIYQALTVLEITQVLVSDIDLKEGTIKVKGNVKNKGRKLHLRPNQVMLFYNYMKETRREIQKRNKIKSIFFILSETGGQLWPGSINKMINQDKKPFERMKPLKIRQSVIHHLLKQNNDIRVVQVFAGHRRAGSTEEYKQSGLEELKAAINKLHPLK